jgi:hypothetical protein
MYRLTKVQEEKWRQRSVALWLKQEDANTKYFHMLASIRRAHNFISLVSIQPHNPNDPMIMVSHPQTILAEFTSYYQNLLGSTSPGLTKPNLQQLYDNQASVNQVGLRPLVDPISLTEIKRAVFAP